MSAFGGKWLDALRKCPPVNRGLVMMAYRLWQTRSADGASAVRIITTCTIVTLLAGCETKTPAPPATSGEREQAVVALNACLQVAARKLDDGKSEANTVALALKPSCATEFALSRDLYARSLSSQQASQYHRQDDQAFKQAATNAVLEERAQKRQ